MACLRDGSKQHHLHHLIHYFKVQNCGSYRSMKKKTFDVQKSEVNFFVFCRKSLVDTCGKSPVKLIFTYHANLQEKDDNTGNHIENVLADLRITLMKKFPCLYIMEKFKTCEVFLTRSRLCIILYH